MYIYFSRLNVAQLGYSILMKFSVNQTRLVSPCGDFRGDGCEGNEEQQHGIDKVTICLEGLLPERRLKVLLLSLIQ